MLVPNDIFIGRDGQHYRVLKIGYAPGEGWVMPISDRPSWPTYRTFGAPTRRVSMSVQAADVSGQRALSQYSEATRKRAKNAFDAIEPLLSEPYIFDPQKRGPLVTARANELGISKTTLYKHLRVYWVNGQSVLALVSKFENIGRAQSGGTANRGRRPKHDQYRIYQVTDEDIKHAVRAIKKYYLSGEISTLAGAYLRMRRDHYSFVDGNGDRFLRPDGECPSIHQFRRIARTKFSLEVIIRKKHGDKEYEREHGPLLGTHLEECVGVGHIFEIDATIADVFLVAVSDRRSIIGKPTLYLIYDRKSRLCVGFYVGLENASWPGAMMAILSIATNKQALCERYGVKYDPDDWPADSVFPLQFLADLGEMASRNSNRICDGMHATVANTQSLLPHRKGTVECGFMLTHASIKESVEGYEPPLNATKRRAKRYAKDASLTLDEFTSVILASIINHNRTVMKGYNSSPDMVTRNVPAIPIEIWNDDVTNHMGTLARYDYGYLHLQLLPQGEAVVHQNGIRFRNCVYDCDEARKLEWFVAAANRKRKAPMRVQCSFDPRLVNHIIVYNPDNLRQSFVCTLASASKMYRGYSFDEVKFINSAKDRLNFLYKQSSDQAASDLVTHLERVVKPAVKATRALTKGISRSGRKADTAEARSAEKSLRRETEASMLNLAYSSGQLPSNVVPLAGRGEIAAKTLADDAVNHANGSITDTLPQKRPSLRKMLADRAKEKLNEFTKQ
ncbi:Mu transposase C-terminal domain-containing protein [Burkholderia pyrrocinia]|uniref:Mu transposase C-terminal domain-containing protein n=1 Tax=Burkholderia pyrrocinia TaxID=60550 RepID=UPI002AAF5D11|nr:Mu transposase C-terminal domain-containing protein [Burkholderia pyrrocinia]